MFPDEIAPRLNFDRLIPLLAQGFRDYFLGHAKVAAITNIDLPEFNGEMHIKPGYMAGGDHVCVKIATCFYDNPSRGLPTRDGVLVLANRKNGQIEAILYDSGLITDMRTAGSSAVAVDALGKSGRITVGLIGAGTQAYWHARALSHVRQIDRVIIWARRPERVQAAAERIRNATELAVKGGTLEEAADCDVVVTATPAISPVLSAERLRPGTLVVAMGADAVGKRELGRKFLEQVSLIVADSLVQCRTVGELQWLSDDPDRPRVLELGAILAGAETGRRAPEDIIVFDSTGVAFQDVISATEVVRR